MFKTGDVVLLKSGSPKMTVKQVNGSEALCQWFDTNDAIQSELFPMESLKVFEMPKSFSMKSDYRRNA